jgi:hypothetical protein
MKSLLFLVGVGVFIPVPSIARTYSPDFNCSKLTSERSKQHCYAEKDFEEPWAFGPNFDCPKAFNVPSVELCMDEQRYRSRTSKARKATPTSQSQQARLEADQARCTVYAYQAIPEYRPPQSPPTQFRSDCYGDRYSWNCDTRALGGGNNAPVGAGFGWGLQQGQERARTDQARQAAYQSCMYDRGWR